MVHPASGRDLELLLPAANADGMGLALEEFARWADPQGSKLLVVLVDNVGWPLAQRLEVPPNVVLHRLLPCTPELQPTEPLWPLVWEMMANVGFDDLAGLQGPVVDRCRWLIDHPEVVRGAVGFQWPAVLNANPGQAQLANARQRLEGRQEPAKGRVDTALVVTGLLEREVSRLGVVPIVIVVGQPAERRPLGE